MKPYIFTIFQLKKLIYSGILIIAYGVLVNCDNLSRSIDEKNGLLSHDEPVYFYLSDTNRYRTINFQENEDIVFHFGIVNHKDSTLSYHVIHGGPIAGFLVYQNDTLVGTSDDGYAYPAVIISGELPAKDTLQYSVSWYSNPYHPKKLTSGNYQATVSPYVYFEDLALYLLPDTILFKIQ